MTTQDKETTGVGATLNNRQGIYGRFSDNAEIAQGLKDYIRTTPNWLNNHLTPSMKQSLDVIMDKVSRILGGDPAYVDNWHDVQGYARLVERQLKGEEP